MVNLSVTKGNETIVSVKKAVEAEIIDFVKKNMFSEQETLYEKRINNWMQDFRISNFTFNDNEKTITLIRELNEKELENIDVEILAQAMRDIMVSFVDYIESLLRESENSHEEIPNATDAEENTPKFFHMDQTEDGFTIEGNIHPMKVVAAILTMIKK